MKCCNRCNKPNCCGDCCSAPCQKPNQFDIQLDPYDSSSWYINGTKVKVPKNETCTAISTDFSKATLNYQGECAEYTLTGSQIGQLIKLDDLRDVEAPHPDNCSFLAFNPHCDYCAEGCRKVGTAWEPYVIPDAGDCVMEPDNQGYYHILKKTDCGCPVECKLPVTPAGMTSLNFIRDSVPDDPDFPWYYGCYNDRINLHLADNAPKYFGKYALKVTINYGIQAIKSDKFPFNYNFRSIVCPVVNNETIKITKAGSILQGSCLATTGALGMPWGSSSLRGSITFVVPKGKEAYLHHEFRVRVNPEAMQYGVPVQSWPNYLLNSNYDGKKVPDAETQINSTKWPASRLNALQVIIEPTQGENNFNPSADTVRSQLDSPVDEYDDN